MAVIEYVGAIKIFAGDFAIKGYSFAQGQLMPIQQNVALFSLYGTFYGGNGVSNFALPDLQSRLPIGQGQGAGLSFYSIGEVGGVENVSLLSATVPQHNHIFNASTTTATVPTAGPSNLLAAAAGGATFYAQSGTTGIALQTMNAQAISAVGGNQPHNNIQPCMGLNYLVALQGVFPSQG